MDSHDSHTREWFEMHDEFEQLTFKRFLKRRNPAEFSQFAVIWFRQFDGPELDRAWTLFQDTIDQHFSRHVRHRTPELDRNDIRVCCVQYPPGAVRLEVSDFLMNSQSVVGTPIPPVSEFTHNRLPTPEAAILDMQDLLQSPAMSEREVQRSRRTGDEFLQHMTREPTTPTLDGDCTMADSNQESNRQESVLAERFRMPLQADPKAAETPRSSVQPSLMSQQDRELIIAQVQREQAKYDRSDTTYVDDASSNSDDDDFARTTKTPKRKAAANRGGSSPFRPISISDNEDLVGPSPKRPKPRPLSSQTGKREEVSPSLYRMCEKRQQFCIKGKHMWAEMAKAAQAAIPEDTSAKQRSLLNTTMELLLSTECDLISVLSEIKRSSCRQPPALQMRQKLQAHQLSSLESLVDDPNASLTEPSNEFYAMKDYKQLARVQDTVWQEKTTREPIILELFRPFSAPDADDGKLRTRLTELRKLGQRLQLIESLLGEGALVVLSGRKYRTKYRTLGKMDLEILQDTLRGIIDRVGDIFQPLSERLHEDAPLPAVESWVFNNGLGRTYAEFLAFVNCD